MTINNCARDWLFDYNISDIDVGHLDEHHIFLKNLFDFSKLKDEEKKLAEREEIIQLTSLIYIGHQIIPSYLNNLLKLIFPK